MDRLKHARTEQRRNELKHLHSNMDRLKPVCRQLFVRAGLDLHSNMDRLKPAKHGSTVQPASIYIPIWID